VGPNQTELEGNRFTVMNTYSGTWAPVSTEDMAALRAGAAVIPEGHVLVEGTAEDIERISATVSAKYRAERKARNKAAKKSRRANRD
jgi:hypothetical protein